MRIPIAEDETKTRRYLAQELRGNGCSVEAAGDGTTAPALACDYTFDVIVLAVMLPGLDGWGVTRALRRGRAGHEIEGPMAVVLLGGLVSSTVLSLSLLPGMALRRLHLSAENGN
jgi:CheY-like chemotaxis protein